MPSRRFLLASAGALAAQSALAGCSALTASPERHYVDVMNGSERQHVFDLTARNDADEVIFERRYDLPAGHGDENRTVEGDPARVTVAVDGTVRRRFRWAPRTDDFFAQHHPDGCSEATSTSLTLTLMDDRFYRQYGCETVTD